MCYACEDDTSRAEVLRPGRRHVVIAPDASTFRSYCRENDLHWITPPAIFIRTDDPGGGRHLHGIREFEIHRVDGALAMEAVEVILDHMLDVRLAREIRGFRGVAPTPVIVDEAVELGQGLAAQWSRALRLGATRPRDEYTMTQAGQDLMSLVARVNHETVPDTGMRHPHHWASTLERSPYWDRSARVLRVWTGDMVLTYRPEELEEDIRYV